MALPVPIIAAPTKRYIGASKRRFTWVPTIANKAVPTSAELSAGTDVSSELAENGVNGFSTTSALVPAADWGTRFTSKVAGMTDTADSSLAVYLSTDAVDLRTLLTVNTNGYIAIYSEGIVTGGKMSIFPVTIISSSVEEGSAGDLGRLMVMFAITSAPVENITIPVV